MISLPRDIPTAMTDEEAGALAVLASSGDVLEIGSLLGYSTIVLAQTANRVYAIDPHDGYPKADPKPTLNGFFDNVRRYGVAHKVIPIVAEAQAVMEKFRPGSFRLIFIDNTVSAGAMIFAANNLDPRYIAIHDYRHPIWTGATEAVHEFQKVFPARLRVVDSLAVIDTSGWR